MPPPHPPPARTHHENQCRPTHPERKPYPRRHGPVVARRDPARRQLRHQTLAREAGVDRTAFYGNRPYAHLRAEFEHRLQQLQHAGQTPDPKTTQIERLKADVGKLRNSLTQANSTIDELTDFRIQALARLAAQHDEILRLRAAADPNGNVTRLPATRQKVIGPY